MNKMLGLLLVVAVIAGATFPLWASCDIKADICSRWCGIRHYDSGIKAAACRAECVGERFKCMAAEGDMGK